MNGKIKKLYERATSGDVLAQNELGVMHSRNGDIEDAIHWYTTAALQGLPEAQLNIAKFYLYGLGVEQDAEKALEWLHKSAEQEFAIANHNLGHIYVEGECGIEQNFEKAFHFYSKAAEQGCVDSFYSIAVMYEQGECVEQSDTEAHKWYLKAAESGIANAQYAVASQYACGRGVDMNVVEAFKWCQKAANQGLPEAQYNLGLLLLGNDPEIRPNKKQAIKLFEKSAAQGFALAEEELEKLLKRNTSTGWGRKLWYISVKFLSKR
ncbi:MAG: sel1 repeat family protein [Holosporales bacterium]|jgi:TPR repeat protein|nr:sel1 repeat family protein [Holosporales bacterium]